MAVIDDRGRLFGRVNIIDAAIGLGILVLIPVAYAAYALFHQPEPRLISVEPTLLTPKTTHVRVHGEKLRPFLRISFNNFQGQTFGLVTPELAEVRVPELPAGTYDVVLYDVAREISRLPGAVKIESAPLASAQGTMIVAGAFVGIDEAAAGELKKGITVSTLGADALVLIEAGAQQAEAREVQMGDATVEIPLTSARQVPAVLRATCTVVLKRCQVAGVDIEPGFVLPVFSPASRALRFVVYDALPDKQTDAEVRVRFIASPEMTTQIKAGDRDRGPALLAPWLAAATSVSASRRVMADFNWHASVPGANLGDWAFTVPTEGAIVDVAFRVPANASTDGLRYRGRALKTGAPFLFETDQYVLRGLIVRVAAAPAAAMVHTTQ